MFKKMKQSNQKKLPESNKVDFKLLGALKYFTKFFPNVHVTLAPLDTL